MSTITIKTKPRKKRVPIATIRKLNTSISNADKAILNLKYLSKVIEDANNGLALTQIIVKKAVVTDKLTAFGHKKDSMGGILDEAILSNKTCNFEMWVMAVVNENPESRKTDLKNNKGLVKRLRDHLVWISGSNYSGSMGFPKRLKRVGLSEHAEEIMNAMTPVSTLFDLYIEYGAF